MWDPAAELNSSSHTSQCTWFKFKIKFLMPFDQMYIKNGNNFVNLMTPGIPINNWHLMTRHCQLVIQRSIYTYRGSYLKIFFF